MEVALRLKVGQAMEQRYIRPAVSVSESELRREFAAQGWERQLKIAHIFTRTQVRAEAALAALRAGRAFAAVAHEFSQNRTTAAHGGEKPYYYSRINAIPAVRDSLFSLPKGAISAILSVPKGYEIFKILDERTAPYEQMRPQVLKAVMWERLQARRRAYIDSLAEQFQWQEVAEGMDRLTRILHSGTQEGDKKVFYLSEADAASHAVHVSRRRNQLGRSSEPLAVHPSRSVCRRQPEGGILLGARCEGATASPATRDAPWGSTKSRRPPTGSRAKRKKSSSAKCGVSPRRIRSQ